MNQGCIKRGYIQGVHPRLVHLLEGVERGYIQDSTLEIFVLTSVPSVGDLSSHPSLGTVDFPPEGV